MLKDALKKTSQKEHFRMNLISERMFAVPTDFKKERNCTKAEILLDLSANISSTWDRLYSSLQGGRSLVVS